MATPTPLPSPLHWAETLLSDLGKALQPPPWVVDEVQQRLVLLLNHVLQQEPEARERLARHRGQVVLLQWREINLKLLATPAGLLDRASPATAPDLTLTLTQTAPFDLARSALRGEKPAVRIEGDVQLAAEVNWLADNVRWDLEEDLARLVGDAPAHAVGQAARRVAEALRRFVGQRKASA